MKEKILALIESNKSAIMENNKFLQSKNMVITAFGEGNIYGKNATLKKQNKELLKIIKK